MFETYISQISKKVSAGAFTPNGKHCIVGDKFGDVHCAAVDAENNSPTCAMLLGHYCSVITSVSVPQVRTQCNFWKFVDSYIVTDV